MLTSRSLGLSFPARMAIIGLVAAALGVGWRWLAPAGGAELAGSPLLPAPLPAAASPAPALAPESPRQVAGTALSNPPEQSSSKTEPPVAPGAYQPPPVIVDGQPRVYPLTRNVWVKPRPRGNDSWIGFLWFGASVRLRDASPQRGPGCRGAWYAVEPRGYVCVDDERATLDPEHPAVRGLHAYAPNLASPWPHRYGESIDLERYASLPSERAQRAREWDYSIHRRRVERARAGEVLETLLGIDLELPAAGELELPLVPKTLPMDRSRLRARSTVAWTREQLHGERAFLLSSDLKWVPKDRVRAYPPVTFHGVHLGEQARLPLAFFRARDRPSYARLDDGSFMARPEGFARLSWVELTGRRETSAGITYLETREPGVFLAEDDAVLPRLAERTPWGAPLDAEVDEKAPERGRATWMEASILGGWLLAYEGRTPVFTTLLAAGRGGPPQRDVEPIETASTPVGRFKITGKFATATMVAPNDLTHSEVPWAQNFSGPHALHAAYWHDGWGELKSGGCLNVSPIDGRWLFHHFTEPKVPEGWHGVRWLPDLEPATTLIVRRR